MNVFPSIILLSQDQLLGELLEQLLRSEGFRFRGVPDVSDVLEACKSTEGAPGVVLIDAIETSTRALRLLDEWAVLEDLAHGPSVPILLAGSTTANTLLQHPRLATVLRVPFSTEGLVEVVRRYARRVVPSFEAEPAHRLRRDLAARV